jgi:hypothetical protein
MYLLFDVCIVYSACLNDRLWKLCVVLFSFK